MQTIFLMQCNIQRCMFAIEKQYFHKMKDFFQ